jgi:RNA polymerase sigma-70 factor (ECF subfamily)
MPTFQGTDTDQLLRRAADGDPEARAQVWNRYRPRLKRMIAMRIDRRIAARIDPSDVVQDALAAAHERLTEYVADPKLAFYPWLRRIAWDRLADAYRTHLGAERRSVLKESPPTPQLNNDSFAELAHYVAASSISPNQRAMHAELQIRVVHALQQLKPHDREILVLRYLEQLGVAEIAGVLGVSQTAVTSRHLRALQRLRRLLRDDLGN